MHDVDAQLRVLHEHLLDREGAVHLRAVAGRSQVDSPWRPGADVNPDGDVELLRQRPVRFHARIVGQDARILVRHLTEHLDVSPGVHRAKRRW